MVNIDELNLLDVGQTIIIKQILGKKGIRKSRCLVKGIYKNFILVEHNDNKVRESFMKCDFISGSVEYEKCVLQE